MTSTDLIQVYNGFIGAVIGAIIGAIAAFFFALWMERRREKRERKKEKEFRKGIISIVSQELETYSGHLERQLVIFKNVLPNEKKSYGIDFLRDFKTLSRYYINMTPEIIARVFDNDTSTTLGKVYQSIQLLTPKIEELISSQETQPMKFEREIEWLKNDIGLGIKSIQNMKID